MMWEYLLQLSSWPKAPWKWTPGPIPTMPLSHLKFVTRHQVGTCLLPSFRYQSGEEHKAKMIMSIAQMSSLRPGLLICPA